MEDESNTDTETHHHCFEHGISLSPLRDMFPGFCSGRQETANGQEMNWASAIFRSQHELMFPLFLSLNQKYALIL